MNKFAVSILLVFVISISVTCGKESKDQKFADKVLESFYIQAKKYETKVKPLIKLENSDENKRKFTNEWAKSIKEMVETLRKIEIEGVDLSLVKTYQKIMNTSQILISLLMVSKSSVNLDKIRLFAERLGSQQLEFELKIKNIGLKAKVSGVD